MNWMEILAQIFELVIIPLLGVGTAYLVYFIKVKIAELKEKTKNEKEKKYLDMLDKTICEAVIATNQTYFEALKKAGKFDGAAQAEAFKKTYETVMKLLTDDAKEFLSTLTADLEADIQNKIEAQVNLAKA